MQFCHGLCQAQAETHAGRAAARIAAVEAFDDFGLFGVVDARAVVGHGNFGAPIRAPPQGDVSAVKEAARLLVLKSAVLKDEGRDFSLTAAQAKLKSGRLAVRASEEAVQIHGGYGYIEEYPVCRFYRDAKILTIGEGTDEVQQMVIARALGA